ncbi:hypothetical protein CEXT_436041 [Caerostris extrusa]|uniref:Uncharacterized protein n=1 Tax=Caerostris extrusa TaxID=172846 RepID=A0AAV4MNJ5_CAEEX|nr:hypothetical protein CEXT_436041 [Caerostris extrusa]
MQYILQSNCSTSYKAIAVHPTKQLQYILQSNCSTSYKAIAVHPTKQLQYIPQRRMPNKTNVTKLVGKDVLPLDIRHVPEFLRKKFEEDAQETSENKQKCLSQLKERLLDHKITKDVDFEDDFLLTILRHHEYKIEKQFQMF